MSDSADDQRAPAISGIAPLKDADGEQTSSSKAKQNNLGRSGLIVSSMTMLSRIFGLIRDIVLARILGAGNDADAFFVAFKIPNFFRRLFAEGAFSQAFVPVLSEYRERGSQQAAKLLVDKVAGNLGSVLLVLTIVVVIASPMFTALFGMGFLLSGDKASFWLTSELLRITFPYLMLISLTGLCSAILNSYDRFAVPAFTPVLLNLVLIAAALLLSPKIGAAFALAWGVLAAGAIQLCFQLPFLARIHMLPRPRLDWKDPGVKRILALMVPALFGVSVAQINLLFDTIIATFLPAGSVAWLYFSDRLTELPLGVFGVGIATVVLPALSRSFVAVRDDDCADNRKRYDLTLDWGLRVILLIGLPASVALILIAEPVLTLLFYYDEMTLGDIAMSSLSLKAYALGLTAFMAIKVLASAFYARQDMKTPVRIAVIALLSNMLLNVLFVLPLYLYWQIGHVGLALATSASALINAVLLYRTLRKQKAYRPGLWKRFIIQLLCACLVMGAVLHMLLSAIGSLAEQAFAARLISVLALVCAGGLSFFAALFMSGFSFRSVLKPALANEPRELSGKQGNDKTTDGRS